jgi:hypothetical protein
MSRKVFVPQLPLSLTLDVNRPIQYKLDENEKEIKFSIFGNRANRTGSKHKASGRGYVHAVGKTSKPSPTHETQHARVVAYNLMRSNQKKGNK